MGDESHVLIVDDDRTALLLIETWLRGAGYRVTTRDRALGTSAEVVRQKPDFVLLDVRMPGISGDELARLLGKAGVAVILHSGASPDTLEDLAKKSGAIGYIVKGDDRRSFLAEFERIVSKERR